MDDVVGEEVVEAVDGAIVEVAGQGEGATFTSDVAARILRRAKVVAASRHSRSTVAVATPQPAACWATR